MWLVPLLFVVVSGIRTNFDKAGLQNPLWREMMSFGGAGVTREKRILEVEGQPAIYEYEACIRPNGKPGLCKPVRHCLQEEFKEDLYKFTNYLCVYQGTTIGACCPDDIELFGPEGLAGDLPATAPREEDSAAVLKIAKAENRGCGLSTRANGRVSDARPADVREWPWMALVLPPVFELYCGGVLVTDRHVLTAAHCTRKWEPEDLSVRLGEYDFKRTNESRTYEFQVVEKRQHQDFEISTYRNDLAILKLNRPCVFNTYVWPICLPPPGLELANETAAIIGWGTQWYGGPQSNVLMEVSIPVWDQQSCKNSYVETIFDENICAGGFSGGKDACQGDSGGPLMYQMSSGRWATIGVVSWGIRCGEPNHPGIYTRVDKYLGWIQENAQF